MNIEMITEASVEADRATRAGLIERMSDFALARNVLRAMQNATLVDQLLAAAAALKGYPTSFVDPLNLLEEVAQRVLADYPQEAEGAYRRARHLVNAA